MFTYHDNKKLDKIKMKFIIFRNSFEMVELNNSAIKLIENKILYFYNKNSFAYNRITLIHLI